MIKKTVISLLIITLILLVLIWGLLQGSLPQYEGATEIDGLSAPVVIERDTLGSVTLRANNRLDMTQALGFIHAQERFFEMDLMRRRAAGELSELFGSSTLTVDRKVRQYRMREHARLTLSQLSAEQKQLLNAYADGVNQGLNALSTNPFVYLLIRMEPEPWQSEDSLLVALSMFLTLNESSLDRELGLSIMHAALPETAYQFLTATGGYWDAPLDQSSFDWPPIPSPHELDFRSIESGDLSSENSQDVHLPGSNSFAVGGALTGGPALVANDMHLTLRVPNIWFRTRLIYPVRNTTSQSNEHHDITGISLPSIPTMIMGSNRYVAWSFTNSYGDFVDWVRITLDPNNPLRYRNASGWENIKTYEEIIHVRDDVDEKLSIQETEWGPILTLDYDKTPLALAWTALRPGGINLGLIELEHAQSTDEATQIAQQAGMPTQNFIVGDRNGHIAWTIAGRIPRRNGNYNPQLPADWSQPNIGWDGWLETAEYPIIHNPSTHRLWSANARMITGNALKLIGDGGYDLGARARQIRDGLSALEYITAQDMHAIQLDHRAIFLERWKQLLESVINQSDDSLWKTKIQQQLQDWNGLASVQSESYLLVRTFRQQVVNKILDQITAVVRQQYPGFKLPRLGQIEHAIWALVTQQPGHLLPASYKQWEDFLLDCVEQATKQINQQIEKDTTPSWGTFNQAKIHHPISRILPEFMARWLNMPAHLLAGDHNMPRVQSPDFGASQRSVVAPGKEDVGFFDMPGGQSGHPLSPYYGSGHANWAAGQPTPFLPGPAVKLLTLHPIGNSVHSQSE